MPTNKEYNDVQLDITFTAASSRANITSQENISISFGKLAKWYNALVPTGGSSGQILAWNSSGTAKWSAPLHPTITLSTDTTSTPAQLTHGGTFTAVTTVTREGNGHVTKINTATYTLPAQYSPPTKKFDGIDFNASADVIRYGVCSTVAATAIKEVTINNMTTLETGAIIFVRFAETNTAAVADLQLKVNSLNAKNIKYKNANVPSAGRLAANVTYIFVYDGTYWQLLPGEFDSDTKVTQTNTTTSANYRVLLSGNANDTTETTTARKSTNLQFNPSSGGLYSFGYLRTVLDDQTLDIDTLTLSDGTIHHRSFIEKTDRGSSSITNIPVAGKPFILEVDLIRWASTTDYITRQRFTNASKPANSYVRYCTNGTWGSWTTRVYTDTNTKVTSAANHYAPATASGQDKTASATGGTADWSIDVVQGVTLNTDGKGHVTGISVTSGKIPANPVPSNNVTGSGTSGYLTKWNGTNTITNGPQLGSSTTTFLRNDGTWQTPVDTKVNVIKDETSKAYLLATTTTPTTTAQGVTSIADTGVYLETTAGCLHLNDTLHAKYVNATDTIYTYSSPTMGNFGGLSLYGGRDPRKVGIMNRKTSTYYGYHGYVTAFVATFLTVDTLDSGWIFKSSTSDDDDPYEVGGNVASINTDGNAVFNGSVTVGGNAANTSGCRMQYNSTTESLDFVFA